MRQIIILGALLVAFLMACTSSDPSKPLVESDGSPSGAMIYRNRCVTCHGSNGRMGNNGAKLLPESLLNVEQRIEVVTLGRNIMPAFQEMLTPEEIKAVAEFTLTLK